jgi:cytochrome c oxidase subunit 3
MKSNRNCQLVNRGVIHVDESPIPLERWRQYLPRWLKRYLPIRGGLSQDHHGKAIFGFTVFLLSESIIFLSFIFTYLGLRLVHSRNWLPHGVSGPQLSTFVIINTVLLLSSSFVIQSAENSLRHGRLRKFRLLLLMTISMGTLFLIGQGNEWDKLDFGLSTGLVGSTFYLLTGFHGLHVLVGIVLQIVMLSRSFIPGNYDKGHFGASATTLFWHFVDIVWVFLFCLLYLWQT